jgi:hypothetical protein
MAMIFFRCNEGKNGKGNIFFREVGIRSLSIQLEEKLLELVGQIKTG